MKLQINHIYRDIHLGIIIRVVDEYLNGNYKVHEYRRGRRKFTQQSYDPRLLMAEHWTDITMPTTLATYV